MGSPIKWVHKNLTRLYGENPEELENRLLYKRMELEARREQRRHARKLAVHRIEGTPSAELFSEAFNLKGKDGGGE
jgi:hypothetical protein